MEAVAGEPFGAWMKREIVDALRLDDTTPDMLLRRGVPFAAGHSSAVLLGGRLVIPGEFETPCDLPGGRVLGPAADLVRFFAQLSPHAKAKRALGRESARDDSWPVASPARWLSNIPMALGIVSGVLDGWEWFGHSGGLQGYISRTLRAPEAEETRSLCSPTRSTAGLTRGSTA